MLVLAWLVPFVAAGITGFFAVAGLREKILTKWSHFIVVALLAATAGSVFMFLFWEMDRTYTKTVSENWRERTGNVTDDLRAPDGTRYVVTTGGNQVQVDGTASYAKGGSLTYYCPKKEGWYGNQYESYCQLARPTREETFGHYPFRLREVWVPIAANFVGCALVLAVFEGWVKSGAKPLRSEKKPFFEEARERPVDPVDDPE